MAIRMKGKKIFGKKTGYPADVLLRQKYDRRTLPNVPDPEKIRLGSDRRGSAFSDERNVDFEKYIQLRNEGLRYVVDLNAKVKCCGKKQKNKIISGKIVDLSMTGALLKLDSVKYQKLLEETEDLKISFEITPGSLPEGLEMSVKQSFSCVRIFQQEGFLYVGIQFKVPLSKYASRKKDRVELTTASIMLFLICVTIMLMRAESIIYFKFNKVQFTRDYTG